MKPTKFGAEVHLNRLSELRISHFICLLGVFVVVVEVVISLRVKILENSHGGEEKYEQGEEYGSV